MKRLAAAVVVTLCWVAPASAHPGHGSEAVTVDGDALRFAPAEVKIGVGENVYWFWQGAVTRNHSVTADPGQSESFDSDPAGPPSNGTHPVGDSFTHTFREEGRFTYHCKVHPEMTGVVNVVALPASAALRLKDLRVADRDDSIRVRYSLSKKADVVVRLTRWRKPKWRPVETVNRNGHKGRNKLEVPADSLSAGRYRIRVTAYDVLNQRASDEARFMIDRRRG
jgi:plastocyanin